MDSFYNINQCVKSFKVASLEKEGSHPEHMAVAKLAGFYWELSVSR